MTPEQRTGLTQLVRAHLDAPDNTAAARAVYMVLQPIAMATLRKRRNLDTDTQVELCNQALFKVFKYLPGVRDCIALEEYTIRVARSVAAEHHRSQANGPKFDPLPEDDDGFQLDHHAAPDGWLHLGSDPVSHHCLKAQVERFCREHPLRASAIEDLAIHRMEMSEVAQRLGRTKRAAEQYISQCRKFLLGYLQVCQG
jgi:DNA-directed RNA polymerase specialized sigma24 family protein